MSNFNTSKNKLKTIWERIQSNSNEIKNKNNVDDFQFFTDLLKQQTIKTPIEIFNSGDIILTSSFIGSTPLKNSPFSTTLSYSQNIDLEIPEILLPFIKYSVEVNSIPDTKIHGLFSSVSYEYVGDDVEIRGDGDLIYKNNSLPNSNTIIGGSSVEVFSDLFFINNNISFNLSKQVWKGTIVENDDDIKTGNVTTIITVFANGNINCNATSDIETFQTNPFTNPDHKIISLTSTSFTAVGDLTIDTFSGGGCTPSQIVTPNVTKTITFSSVDSYQIAFDQGVFINSADIKSQDFERNGNWLFWSALKQKSFKLTIFGSDGDFKEIVPSNFPNTNVGDTLPYTNITVKRNIINPVTIEESDDLQGVTKTEREFKNYVKTSPATASIPIYRFNLDGSFVLVTRATEKSNTTTDFPVYNDIYTVVGTTYNLTTENHSILSLDRWTGTSDDITMTIKAHLINPLYWKEQRRYNKNDF